MSAVRPVEARYAIASKRWYPKQRKEPEGLSKIISQRDVALQTIQTSQRIETSDIRVVGEARRTRPLCSKLRENRANRRSEGDQGGGRRSPRDPLGELTPMSILARKDEYRVSFKVSHRLYRCRRACCAYNRLSKRLWIHFQCSFSERNR